MKVYFKAVPDIPHDDQIGKWRQEIWNEGFAPLLWIVSPERINLYNGFGSPVGEGDAEKNLLRTFENIEAELRDLDALAGRLAMETGRFWAKMPQINRKTSVDEKLLSALGSLERDLVKGNLEVNAAQALIGRVIFTQYLIDRKIVDETMLKERCGHTELPAVLRNERATARLFKWLTKTFNGDMFPESAGEEPPDASHLNRVANFLEATDPDTGQRSLFPYQFNVIPVELISSIYERFAHTTSGGGVTEARRNSVHYTRLSVVSLVLDEVMDGLTGKESVLDLACGSGVFLVEALRRLVHLRAGNSKITRELIRTTLHEQIYGVDISEAAIRVAAFSLYLAALELDPDPQPPHSLRFKRLVGETLLVGDARTIERDGYGKRALTTQGGLKKFDLVVGNPPWSFKGREGTALRRETGAGQPALPRDQGLDFVLRAQKFFSHEKTRFGIVLSAKSFSSRSDKGRDAMLHVMRTLAPVTLVDLSNLSNWLFATAKTPAMILFAHHRPQQKEDRVTVVQVPWTIGGERTHTFDVAPRDVTTLSLNKIEQRSLTLTAATRGRRRDLMLLDELTEDHQNLGEQLKSIGTSFRQGLIQGGTEMQTSDTGEIKKLEMLNAKDMKHFYIPDKLQPYGRLEAGRPRSRDTYRSPLVIVKELLGSSPRLVTAVAERDVVFNNSRFGASMPNHGKTAHLLAAILSSALASWFFSLTAAEFGIQKRKVSKFDLHSLPLPNLNSAVKSKIGRRLLAIEKRLCQRDPTVNVRKEDWTELDELVFDLYELDWADKDIIRDGLVRIGWCWKNGREKSSSPADSRVEVKDYARVFLYSINNWLAVRNKRSMRAEVIDLPTQSALRVVRFVLEDEPGKTDVSFVEPQGDLNKVLEDIGGRLKFPITETLRTERELCVHVRNGVVIIKPAAKRYWMRIVAIEDADVLFTESVTGTGSRI
ncbi:MAG: N-6 DNA methylase [Candidatus Dadabacteria bacterium]|nr:N-6 DNA methylase [Candidatus Dadabacteria bacterium]